MPPLRVARTTAREFHILNKLTASPFRDIPSLGVIEGAEQDADDVDDLPDKKTSTRQNLQNT